MSIILKNITHSFGKHLVIDDLSFGVKEGESYVIIGGSGQGKSVLMRIMSGLLNPIHGEILINNQSIYNDRDTINKNIFNDIGFVFQSSALFDSMSVFDNIAFKLMRVNKLTQEASFSIVKEKLKIVGIDEKFLHTNVGNLSGGMRKRVAIARAIATNPKILFFDEPTTGLDPIMSNVVNDLILECKKNLKCTTITITHDIQSAVKIGDKISYLKKGKFIWTGNANELYQSNNIEVEDFIVGRY